uniref:Nuclear pore protein n=1 Tax=Rhabditophanes sp. KR3021 TaxID=114890 RepID=A0AC35TUE3_9BILA
MKIPFNSTILEDSGLANTRNNGAYFNDVVESTCLDADIHFLNLKGVEKNRLHSFGGITSNLNLGHKRTEQLKKKSSIRERMMPQLEESFAQTINSYAVKRNTKALFEGYQRVVRENSEICNGAMWNKVLQFFSKSIVHGYTSVREFRMSKEFHEGSVVASLTFLQKEFKEHMECVVQKNLKRAKRGGKPGNEYLIEAYLNVISEPINDSQELTIGSHSGWKVLFCALRMGDFKLLERFSAKISSPDHSEVAQYLSTITTNPKLSDAQLKKLAAEYEKVCEKDTDHHKRAIYGVLIDEEVEEINNSLENWTWSKIMTLHVNQEKGIEMLHNFQKVVKVDFGESYFVDESGNVSMYFSLLWLSGQYEAAIDALYRGGHVIEAVHIAILCHENEVLLISKKLSDDYLTSADEEGWPHLCGINFPRLVIYYLQRFFTTNSISYVEYSGILKNYCTQSGENLFAACISKLLCNADDERNRILGFINQNGEQKDGLINRYAQLDIPEVISQVAGDLNYQGKRIQAAKLYSLIKEMDTAAKVLNELLSSVIVNKSEVRSEALCFTHWFLEICIRQEHDSVDAIRMDTLQLLYKLGLFFEYAQDGLNKDAIYYMNSLKFIPVNIAQVPSLLEMVGTMATEVRMILPDILLAYVTCLVEQWNCKNEDIERFYIRDMGQAIIQYVGRISLKFPTHVHNKLLQLFVCLK